MNSESAAHGHEARNALQLQLLKNREMDDALAGLKFLRALPYVDARNVAAIGHSFGGSLTVLLAERAPNLRAVVVFSGAGYSFDRSPELRARLLAAIDHVAEPVFFIHAENDYSLSCGKVLDARREHIGKPHRLKIYPPIAHTADEGHDFLYLGVNIWEPTTLVVFSYGRVREAESRREDARYLRKHCERGDVRCSFAGPGHARSAEHSELRSMESQSFMENQMSKAYRAEFEKMIVDLKIDRTPAWYSTIAEWKTG